jgi:hypothetical protein
MGIDGVGDPLKHDWESLLAALFACLGASGESGCVTATGA